MQIKSLAGLWKAIVIGGYSCELDKRYLGKTIVTGKGHFNDKDQYCFVTVACLVRMGSTVDFLLKGCLCIY